MVRNWIKSNGEKIQYISPDNKVYNLHDPNLKSVITMTGWGLPSAEIASTRGPFQHGVDPLTIRIPSRTINMTIRHNGCDREEYWSNRTGLVDVLRLNRTSVNNPSPGHLKWYRADGQVRQVDVFIAEGPNFNPSRSGWDEFSYTDELVFIAHNPIIYNPTQQVKVFTELGCSFEDKLSFPFSFGTQNIIFSDTDCSIASSLTINYLGNWQEFPLIVVQGPADNFILHHIETGFKISLAGYRIDHNERVTIDLRYGKKTVILNNTNESLLGYISDDSNLGSFALEPSPVTVNGVNNIAVTMDNSTSDTQVVLYYYDKYVSI